MRPFDSLISTIDHVPSKTDAHVVTQMTVIHYILSDSSILLILLPMLFKRTGKCSQALWLSLLLLRHSTQNSTAQEECPAISPNQR